MLPHDITSDFLPVSLLSSAAAPSLTIASTSTSQPSPAAYATMYAAYVKKELDRIRSLADEDLRKVRDAAIRDSKPVKPAAASLTSGGKPTVPPTVIDASLPLFLQDRTSSPQFVFVLNKQSPTEICEERFQRALSCTLQKSIMRLPIFRGSRLEPVFHFLPLYAEDGSEADPSHVPLGVSWRAATSQLTSAMLRMKGREFSRARGFSEKEWLKGAVRMWEVVKLSPVVLDYANSLKATLFADAPASETS